MRAAGQNDTAPKDYLGGDTAADEFWRHGTMAIFDICVTAPDFPYQRGINTSKVLTNHEKRKKRKYLQM